MFYWQYLASAVDSGFGRLPKISGLSLANFRAQRPRIRSAPGRTRTISGLPRPMLAFCLIRLVAKGTGQMFPYLSPPPQLPPSRLHISEHDVLLPNLRRESESLSVLNS